MTERWLVVGTDERMKVLAKSLATEERTVYYKNKAVWDQQMNTTAIEFQPHVVVLPIQPLEIDVPVVLGIQQAVVHVGKLSTEWESMLHDQYVHRYLQRENFIWQNAALTAEAFLAYFYKQKKAVRYKKFIITGFGRVAKMTAHMLKSMQAEVIIMVRSTSQRCEALALGYESYLLDDMPVLKAECIINTIPAQWLSPTKRKELALPIFDLASAPGCVQEKTEDYVLLTGLPGKYFSGDAALLLKNAILEWRVEGA